MEMAPNEKKRRKRWDPEEDARLMEAVARFGFVWPQIARHVATRSTTSCRRRISQLDLETGRREHPRTFTAQEMVQLLLFVQQHGKKWKAFSDAIGERNDNAVKNLWYKTLVRNFPCLAPPTASDLPSACEEVIGKLTSDPATAFKRQRLAPRGSGRYNQGYSEEVKEATVSLQRSFGNDFKQISAILSEKYGEHLSRQRVKNLWNCQRTAYT